MIGTFITLPDNSNGTLESEPINQMDELIGFPFHTTTSNPKMIPGQPTYSYDESICNKVVAAAKMGAVVAPYLCVNWGIFTSVIKNSLSTFVTDVKRCLIEHGYGKIVLDPEGGRDPESMKIVIDALYDALNPLGLKIGITGHFGQQGKYGVDVDLETFKKLDDVHVLCYDMGGWSSLGQVSSYPHSSYELAIAAVQKWLDAGYPKEKIVMTIPGYGRSTYSSGTSPTIESLTYAYIVSKVNPSNSQNTATIKNPTSGITKPYTWVCPDDFARLEEWAKEKIKGVCMYTLGYDVPYSDSRSLAKQLIDHEEPDIDPIPETGGDVETDFKVDVYLDDVLKESIIKSGEIRIKSNKSPAIEPVTVEPTITFE